MLWPWLMSPLLLTIVARFRTLFIQVDYTARRLLNRRDADAIYSIVFAFTACLYITGPPHQSVDTIVRRFVLVPPIVKNNLYENRFHDAIILLMYNL